MFPWYLWESNRENNSLQKWTRLDVLWRLDSNMSRCSFRRGTLYRPIMEATKWPHHHHYHHQQHHRPSRTRTIITTTRQQHRPLSVLNCTTVQPPPGPQMTTTSILQKEWALPLPTVEIYPALNLMVLAAAIIIIVIACWYHPATVHILTTLDLLN